MKKAIELIKEMKSMIYQSKQILINKNTVLDKNKIDYKLTLLWNEIEKLEDKLYRILQWCKAYPVDIFPEPTKEDWKNINKILKKNGYVLDRISASNMRYVVNGIKNIIEED